MITSLMPQAQPALPPGGENRAKKSVPEGEPAFAGALAVAGTGIIPAQAEIKQQLAPIRDEVVFSQPPVHMALENAAEPAEAKMRNMPKGMPDLLHGAAKPLEARQAVGLNTVNQVAGLKPWSREWVFRGNEDANPQLATLIPESRGEASKVADTGTKASMRGDVEAAITGPADQLPEMKPVAGKAGKIDASQLKQAMIPGDAEAARALLARLNELGGELESINTGIMPLEKKGEKVRASKDARISSISSMSGGEFVDALGGMKKPGVVMKAAVVGSDAAREEPMTAAVQPKAKATVQGLTQDAGQNTGIENPVHHAVAGPPAAAMPKAMPAAPVTVLTGHVTQGQMAKERLSTQSLGGLSSELRNLSQTGGGEIRIRLKPEHLGELSVRVVTNGNNVGLQIRASDEKAKQVIEESLGYLRESLASQRLNLGSVDLTVATAPGISAGQETAGQHGGDLAGSAKQWDGSGQQQSAGNRGFDGFLNQEGSRPGITNEGWKRPVPRDPLGGLAAGSHGSRRIDLRA